MAIGVLSHDVIELVNTLSDLPSSQLAIAITQHPSLSTHLVDALRNIAANCIQDSFPNYDDVAHQQGNQIADIVRKVIARGDPSLVKKLLPRQSSLIDLALCTNAKDILARLVDETSAFECIKATTIAFQRLSRIEAKSEEERYTRINRSAQAVASVVSAMPMRKTVEEKLTKAQRERASQEKSLICDTISNLRAMYEELTFAQSHGNQAGLLVFKAKVSLLDATWFLVERLLKGFVKSTLSTPDKVLDGLMEAICGTSQAPLTGSVDGTSFISSKKTPLVDLPVVLDLTLVRPLIESIHACTFNYSSKLFDELTNQKKDLTGMWGDDLNFNLLGSAWSEIVDASIQSSQGEKNALIDTMVSVLPNLEMDRAGLQKRLESPRYIGKDAESILQLLFEEEEEEKDRNPNFSNTNNKDDLDTLRILQERANILDEQQLQGVTVSRGKAKQREMEQLNLSSGLTEEIRAAILARAEEPDSDEEQESWNPFHDDAAFEVGFEEELEEDIVEDTTVGKNAAKMSKINADDDEEDKDDDEQEEGGEADGERGATRQHGGSPFRSNNVAAERASERILISAWSERGESFFSKDARKAAKRIELKGKLNDLPGQRWDDGLIESWATMFSRNPRKDKLLAAVGDIMMLGNQNLSEDAEGSGFGPNRGRGGRIMTGPREGGQGGRGRGSRGRGRGNRGGGGAAKRGRGS